MQAVSTAPHDDIQDKDCRLCHDHFKTSVSMTVVAVQASSLDPASILEGVVQQLRAVAKRFVLCRRAEQVRCGCLCVCVCV